jgi:hypothetical protein
MTRHYTIRRRFGSFATAIAALEASRFDLIRLDNCDSLSKGPRGAEMALARRLTANTEGYRALLT